LHWGNISPASKAARRRRLRNTLDFGRTTTEEGCGDFAGLRVGYFLWWVISEEDVRCEGVKKREDDHERARNNEIQDIQYAAANRPVSAERTKALFEEMREIRRLTDAHPELVKYIGRSSRNKLTGSPSGGCQDKDSELPNYAKTGRNGHVKVSSSPSY
jgi:hypothetical protein